jgi:hypothetical protein
MRRTGVPPGMPTALGTNTARNVFLSGSPVAFMHRAVRVRAPRSGGAELSAPRLAPLAGGVILHEAGIATDAAASLRLRRTIRKIAPIAAVVMAPEMITEASGKSANAVPTR